MTLQETIALFCRENSLLPKNGHVLAAVSGGADSMCMLHLLMELSRREGFMLTAAHLNHNLRGEESAEDLRFVRAHCEALGIPCICGKADVSGEVRRTGKGVEEAARDLRYAFLRKAAEDCGADSIATAHTADDNAETMLMNLARGTGLRGLCGIPVKRECIIRPILCLTRMDVEAYLTANGIPHREDSTNAEDIYTRNRLRHRGMPALRELYPEITRGFFDASMLLREDEAYLSAEAQRFLAAEGQNGRLSAKALAALPFPIASRVIRLCCPAELGSAHVKAVLDLCGKSNPSARLDLPGICVRREYDELVFGDAPQATVFPSVTLDTPEGEAELSGTNLRIRWRTLPEIQGIYKSFTSFLFKTEDICGKITVRSRKTGDKLVLQDTGCEKTVKKLMIEHKIPACRRGILPIAADDNGPLAVYGLARARRALPEIGGTALEIFFEESAANDNAE